MGGLSSVCSSTITGKAEVEAERPDYLPYWGLSPAVATQSLSPGHQTKGPPPNLGRLHLLQALRPWVMDGPHLCSHFFWKPMLRGPPGTSPTDSQHGQRNKPGCFRGAWLAPEALAFHWSQTAWTEDKPL